MCEERVTRMKRDMRLAKRRARRMRLVTNYMTGAPHVRPVSPASSDSDGEEPPAHPCAARPQPVDLQRIATRTAQLMRRNVEIQRRVEELKKETAAFVMSVVREPIGRSRLERLAGVLLPAPPSSEASSVPLPSPPPSPGVGRDDARGLPDPDDAIADVAHDVETHERVR